MLQYKMFYITSLYDQVDHILIYSELQSHNLYICTSRILRRQKCHIRLFFLPNEGTYRAETFLFYSRLDSPVVLGRLLIEASRSHTVIHPTLGRTPLEGLSVYRWALYLVKQHWAQTSIPPAGFESKIPASFRS
jgi:hypothetical protein